MSKEISIFLHCNVIPESRDDLSRIRSIHRRILFVSKKGDKMTREKTWQFLFLWPNPTRRILFSRNNFYVINTPHWLLILLLLLLFPIVPVTQKTSPVVATWLEEEFEIFPRKQMNLIWRQRKKPFRFDHWFQDLIPFLISDVSTCAFSHDGW